MKFLYNSLTFAFKGKMYSNLLICVALTLVGFVFGLDETTDAQLLASKSILNQIIVSSKDLTVQYEIFNVGGRAALDVSLTESGFPDDEFDVVRGFLNVGWQRIAPGANVTHTVVLMPKNFGFYNFSNAEISYKASETAEQFTKGYTSAPGEERVVNFRDYDRKFSSHAMDWFAFAVMVMPSLCIPLFLWYSSKSQYDKFAKQKDVKKTK